jgi:hypothetical protein
MHLNPSKQPQIMTSDPDSFARGTIVDRKPKIIQQVLSDHNYPPEIIKALENFRQEIASEQLQPITEPSADAPYWNNEVHQYGGLTWLEIPWYFAEAYFYRRLLEAVRYFQPGAWQGKDPFGPQKVRQTRSDLQQFAALWEQINSIPGEQRFGVLLHSALWGNRTDLSNFTTEVLAAGGLAVSAEQHLILIDHTGQVDRLLKPGVRRVDFINDNAGIELIFDLALAAHLIEQGLASEVDLQPQKPAAVHLRRDAVGCAPYHRDDANGQWTGRAGRLFTPLC